MSENNTYEGNNMRASNIYEVRRFKKSDLPDVKNLDDMSGNYVYEFLDGLDEEEFASCSGYGIFVNGDLAGYCTLGGGELYDRFDEYKYGDRCLSDVFIKEQYRGKHLGSTLVSDAISLELANGNESIFATLLDDSLLEFYSKLGFNFIDINAGVIFKNNKGE